MRAALRNAIRPQVGAAASTPGRLAPDANDVLVYNDFSGLSAGAVPNEGSAGALTLSAGGALINLPGQFAEVALGCTAQNSGGTAGGVLYSAGTTYGENTEITLSAWLWVLGATSYPGFTPIFGKTVDPTTFSPAAGPVSATLFLLQDGTAGGYVALDNGDAPGLVTPAIAPNDGWHHLGITHDGTTLKLYFDGALADSVSAPHAVNWGNHGRVITGGFVNNGSVYASPPAVVSDRRWANVVRPASYFTNVWATRRTA